jgi:hypothetical protein
VAVVDAKGRCQGWGSTRTGHEIRERRKAIEGSNAAALRVLTLRFSPGIRGLRKAFRVRAVATEGCLWLVEQDAGEAIGWHPDTSRHRRQEALTGDAWGYSLIPTGKGGHLMMAVVSREALSDLLARSRERQARVFKVWLESITTPA